MQTHHNLSLRSDPATPGFFPLRMLSALAASIALWAADNDKNGVNPLQLGDHPELILVSHQAWGLLGLNTAAHAPNTAGAPLAVGDRVFEKGLGHHAAGSITLLLDSVFSAFDAVVGVQPCNGKGSVVFRVFVDGEKKFDSGVMRETDVPRAVHVPLEKAWELQLEADDAADGIECDMANWADARLTPATDHGALPSEPAVNIVPFGRVITCDPNRHEGTRASRTEEFHAGDFLLETQLLADRDGGYQVPVSSNGLACIGADWLTRRAIKSIALDIPSTSDLPDPARVRVQAWFGESLWQGRWQDLPGKVRVQANRIVFETPVKGHTGGLLRTWKIRWILPATGKSVVVRHPVVFTRSRWADDRFRIELGQPPSAGQSKRLPGKATLRVVDGALLEPSGGKLTTDRPTTFTVRYARPSSLLSELTLLRIQRGAETTSISIEDVLSNNVVYVPAAGVLVCREDRPVTITQYRERIAGRKTILEQVRQLPDQTLAQALARTHHPAQNEGPVMLSLACDNAKVIVERNGDLRWHTGPATNTDWLASAASLKTRLAGTSATNHTRRLEGGWLPVPVISAEHGPLVLSQRTFVAPTDQSGLDPFRPNRASVCIVQLTLTNTSYADVTADLSLAFVANARSNKPADLARRPETDAVVLLKDGNRVLGRAVCERAGLEISTRGGVLNLAGPLASHSTANVTACLAIAGQTLPEMLDTEQLRAELERYWRAALAPAMQVETPDSFLNDLIRSSQVRCLVDARSEAGGERVAAWIAAMAYGPLESEAHSVIRGMDYLGHSDFARRSLDYFIHRYNSNGFLTTGYTTFGTGWHLWTLGEHWRLTHDTTWLRANASELARVGSWVLRQTQKTRLLTTAHQPVRGYGLMPPGVLADWNAFAQHFCLSAYYAAGLRGLGQALGSIGHPDAQLFLRGSRELAAATLRAFELNAAEAPVVPLRNGTWVPFYPAQAHTPGMVARSFPGEDAGRSWAYNVELGAHQMVPTGVLSASSPRTGLMLDHMEDVSFLESGWFDYPAAENERDWFNLGGFAKVQPFYCRNAEICAMRDDVKPFLRSYFNSLASLVNREVLTFWEHFNHSGAWDKTHETGYFLHQTRTMFVQERDDQLWLAALVPCQWIEDGRTVTVVNAPTFFGPVSYKIRSCLTRDFVEVHIEPPKRNPPRQIVIRLRHPDGKPLRLVEMQNHARATFSAADSTIRVKPGKGPIDLRAMF